MDCFDQVVDAFDDFNFDDECMDIPSVYDVWGYSDLADEESQSDEESQPDTPNLFQHDLSYFKKSADLHASIYQAHFDFYGTETNAFCPKRIIHFLDAICRLYEMDHRLGLRIHHDSWFGYNGVPLLVGILYQQFFPAVWHKSGISKTAWKRVIRRAKQTTQVVLSGEQKFYEELSKIHKSNTAAVQNSSASSTVDSSASPLTQLSDTSDSSSVLKKTQSRDKGYTHQASSPLLEQDDKQSTDLDILAFPDYHKLNLNDHLVPISLPCGRDIKLPCCFVNRAWALDPYDKALICPASHCPFSNNTEYNSDEEIN